ncbi:MAG TPA: L-aspartate oxidase [Saprospiraceae bacterium]|nr:L-aspartate oxidase [Saprospiraceae bacterium]MCB9270696.1 L-aspartate oxidase [Lewinellaceae bacterium]HPG05934.1 L-aspartate oxidase [Saprospiraceae bacterium]HPR01092.1 L-aspartate oxidase [Saprospiraceae bacterium]HQU51862.1 L-aspartate oxidase [Saprospiraceae bacterium]
MTHTSDVLILGSGVAGLSVAIKLAMLRPDLNIQVLTKTDDNESNTRYAQGGVAAVWDFEKDTYEKHIADTLDAGDGLCDLDVVEIVVKEGPERVKEIIGWGTRFDKNKENDYDLGREGGHTENRILHYKDLTGWEIQRALLEKAATLPNIIIHEHFFAINLLTQHHLGYNITRATPNISCFGVYALNKTSHQIETFIAKKTVLCTGGAGQIYRNTTNPTIASGDGIAMMYRAKGRIANMEFVQFHPTALYNPAGENPDFLVSEAVRGFGAILKTKDGKEFMQRYDPRKSLAPRDIVARAIDNEMKVRGDDFVCLDCTHLEKEAFVNHFPTIYEKCLSIGIDPMKQMIPVVPACHYFCGGIQIDTIGKTSLDHLYAAGECTCSGLHGANRLASNSLLEGLVFGDRIAHDIAEKIDDTILQMGIPEWNAEGTTAPNEMVLITQSWKELKEIMSSYVGIVRSNVRSKRAMDRLDLLFRETEMLYNTSVLSPQLCELRNLITIGYLVTRSASMRRESRGLHFTTDYPNKNPFLEYTYL